MAKLTEEDLLAIESRINQAIDQRLEHPCRLDGITRDDIKKAVLLAEHVEQLTTTTGNLILKTIVVAGVGGTLTLIGIGAMAKIKEYFGS